MIRLLSLADIFQYPPDNCAMNGQSTMYVLLHSYNLSRGGRSSDQRAKTVRRPGAHSAKLFFAIEMKYLRTVAGLRLLDPRRYEANRNGRRYGGRNGGRKT